jgi:hypothetical protein
MTSLNNNRTSVTSMVMTADKSRLVSSGLDNSLSIWNIVRKNDVIFYIKFRLFNQLFLK